MDIIELTQTKQWDKGSREDEGVSFHSGYRKGDGERNMGVDCGAHANGDSVGGI